MHSTRLIRMAGLLFRHQFHDRLKPVLEISVRRTAGGFPKLQSSAGDLDVTQFNVRFVPVV
jgi:hypothetical protein